MTRQQFLAAPLALALAAGLPVAAFAASERDARVGETRTGETRTGETRIGETRRGAEQAGPAGATIDAAAAITAARSAGYATIRGVEWERGGWEVKAVDSVGQRASLHVDAATGVVTPRRR